MSLATARTRVAPSAEQAASRPDPDTWGKIHGEQDQPDNITPAQRFKREALGLVAAAVVVVIMFVVFFVHLVEHERLDVFLTTVFGRGNAASWPMQLVWSACAVVMVGLALWPLRRAPQIISLLAAAYRA
jgi:hypothetical protein